MSKTGRIMNWKYRVTFVFAVCLLAVKIYVYSVKFYVI